MWRHTARLLAHASGFFTPTTGLRRDILARIGVALLLLGLLGAGCASAPTAPPSTLVEPTSPPDFEPVDDRATVVFMRPSALAAGARTVALFDITDGAQLLSILENGTNTIARLEPGTRMFMGTIAGQRSIMRAEIEAGKIYYVKVYAAQLTALSPQRHVRVIQKYWSSTRQVTVTDSDIEWDRNNRRSIELHAQRAHETWNAWNEAVQLKFRLGPEDAVDWQVR